MTRPAPLAEVEDLSITFRTRAGLVQALEGVSLAVAPGEIVGVVGESGSGKSVTAFAMMGLLDPAARVGSGRVLFAGRDVLAMSPRELATWRGREASIVFQNPRAALNPIRRVGDQIADVIARHAPAAPRVVAERVVDAMRRVRIPDPERRRRAYPFELSGGMCQRVGIAMALACAPRLLIADEPTTGLDVTTQAVIMDLIAALARSRALAVVLITHDLALAANYCDRIVVMHAGQVVESGPAGALIAAPRHPYSRKLLMSLPSAAASIDALQPIEGSLPDLRRTDLPACRFSARCDRYAAVCDGGRLRLQPAGTDRAVACRRPL